jgi:hypothetical protein
MMRTTTDNMMSTMIMIASEMMTATIHDYNYVDNNDNNNDYGSDNDNNRQ